MEAQEGCYRWVRWCYFDSTEVECAEDSSLGLYGEKVCKGPNTSYRSALEKTRGGRGGGGRRRIQMRGEDEREDRDSRGGQRGGLTERMEHSAKQQSERVASTSMTQIRCLSPDPSPS